MSAKCLPTSPKKASIKEGFFCSVGPTIFLCSLPLIYDRNELQFP